MRGNLDMKKKNAVIMAISLTSLICLVLFAFISYYTSMNRKISKDLNSSIPITLEFEYKDSHHWFLGDGATIAKAKLEDDDIIKIMEKSKREWLKTPIPIEIQERVYGNEFNEALIQDALIPEVKNGYWTFLDRYRLDNGLETEPNVYYENTGNYSLGVIDLDNNILYYIKFDS